MKFVIFPLLEEVVLVLVFDYMVFPEVILQILFELLFPHVGVKLFKLVEE